MEGWDRMQARTRGYSISMPERREPVLGRLLANRGWPVVVALPARGEEGGGAVFGWEWTTSRW